MSCAKNITASIDCKRMERCQVGIGCDKFVCSDCDSWKMGGDCSSERRGSSLQQSIL